MSIPVATSNTAIIQRSSRASGSRATALAFGLSLTALPTPTWAQTAEQLEQQYGREAMAQALDAKRRYDLYGVHFEIGQATIQPQSQALLDDIAEVMKSFPTWRLEIVGHTDAAGDPAQNEALSRARADAVRAALVQRGIAEGRLVPRAWARPSPSPATTRRKAARSTGESSWFELEPQPNILVIWGDDIGWYNISAYNLGVMGYRTPNIDRIAREGALFTDWYGQQSCTAGRAAFATGQSPVRTGLTKVGLPGAPEGLTKSDPTIADLLKPLGYATGQFGKNHLGDRNEHLPTVHGFDEFFGNLYHLNAEEEPENIDYPTNPEFKGNFGPRGVLHCYATALEEAGEDPRFGAWGKQKCEDTGPLTAERMETVDREFLTAAAGFIDKAHQANQPFFVWYNTTRMHIWTHLAPEAEGKTGIGVYPDGMVEHDGMVGELLAKLDQLGIADDTIVMYATDNGAEVMSWPDGGTTPFRGEKNTNWEGGYRVPSLIRWPGVIEPGTIHNEVFAHEDMLPTLLAAAGDPDVVAELQAGKQVGDADLQGASRRLQPAALPEGRGRRGAAQGVPLLDRRRPARGAALRPVEAQLPRAARPRLRRLGGAVRRAAPAQAVHPARRPVRARRPRGHGLPALADRPRLHAGAGPGLRLEMAAELRPVPAADEGGELRHRRGDAEDDRGQRQQLIDIKRRLGALP